MNDHLAQRKRQYDYQYTGGEGDPSAGSSQAAFGESQMLCRPRVAKQQKLEVQSSMMRSQATGGQRFQGGQPSVRHNMGSFNKPGHWGSWPRQSPPATAQPVRPPYPPPLRTANGWLPPDRPDVQPDGRSRNDDPKPAADVLPEMPAEQEIDRLRAELRTLEKDYHIFISSENVSSNFSREKYTQEFRNKRRVLQDKMKKETERQRIENLQLSQQFAQQYNVSLGSDPCETPSTEAVNSDSHSKNKTENEKDKTLSAVSDEIERLTCQSSVIDSKMKMLMSQDFLTEEEQRKFGCFRQQLKALDQKLGLLTEKRDKLLKQSMKKRKMFQDEMKKETKRQRIENLQQSQQSAQQYNLSLGSDPCETPTTEVVNSDSHSKNKTENEEEGLEALTAVSGKVKKLTHQRSVVESKIETLMSQDCLTEEEQRKLSSLRQQFYAMDRRLGKLLKQSVKKMDTDPFHALGKLVKKMQAWREFKHSELTPGKLDKKMQAWREYKHSEQTAVEGELHGNSMGSSNTLRGIGSKENEEEVIVISDEDEDVKITSHTGMTSTNTQQKQSCRRRHRRIPKPVKLIDQCVTESGMVSAADESHFLLSGLAGILLQHQQHRRQTQTLPTISSAAEQPSAVSQLIGEMTSKLNLVAKQGGKDEVQKPHKKQVQEKTVNLYMKIYNEQS